MNDDGISLAAKVEVLAKQQKEFLDHLKELHKIILAPTEIVRDEKGKAKAIRKVYE